MNFRHYPAFLALPLLTVALAAQGTLSQHGEVVFGAGLPMPSSFGASPNDFPAGAVMLAGDLGSSALQPMIDANGTVMMRVQARPDAALGIHAGNNMALLRGRNAADLRMVLRRDDPISGLPATTRINGGFALRTFRQSSLGDHLLVVTEIDDATVPSNTPTTADEVLLVGQAGALQVLMREGDPVPGAGGGVFGPVEVLELHLNDAGRALFRNRMPTGIGGVTTANNSIVMVGTAGNLTTMLREGSPWNGVGATGEVVGVAGADTNHAARFLRQWDDGRILHDLRFVVPSGSATSTANDSALAVWNNGTDTILVREGDQAPGMPLGAVFADNGLNTFPGITASAHNRAGQFVFSAVFPAGPGGVTAADDQALFLYDGSSLSLVAREGDPAPAAFGAGITLAPFLGTSVLTENGNVGFAAALGGAVTASNDSAILFGQPGALAPIVREGDAVPGYPGFVFGPFDNTNTTVFAANDSGCLLFRAGIANRVGRFVMVQYTPEHGLAIHLDPNDPVAAPLGTTTLPVGFGAVIAATSDSAQTVLNHQGDVAFVLSATGAESSTIGCTYVRGHLGSLLARPASLPATGGSQQFGLDAGSANGNAIYLLAGTLSGTRPGFVYEGKTIPLNQDVWFQLSLGAANSSVYPGSFGFLDAQGRANAAFQFPSGIGGFGGALFHHAFVVIDPVTAQLRHVSEAASVRMF